VSGESLVQADKLKQFCIEALQTAGIPSDHAEIIAGLQVEADLRGVHSHGAIAVTGYINRINQGGTNPKPDIKILNESANHALVDGDDGLGQIVAYKAMEICINKAKKSGIATVGVHGSGHFGAAANYSSMAVKEDLIGIVTTNAAAIIPPTGTKTGIFGTNPISYAIPARDSYPVVMDIASSLVATQKIVQARREGQKIPPEWGMDKDGNPTDNPEVALTSGIQPPMAGHKGYGLAMMVEIFSAVLTGARFGRSTAPANWAPSQKINVGHFFIAIDPALFMPIDDFKDRIEQLIKDIKDASLLDGVEKVYIPGEIEFEKKEKNLKDGIPFPPATLAQLEKYGTEIGVKAKLR